MKKLIYLTVMFFIFTKTGYSQANLSYSIQNANLSTSDKIKLQRIYGEFSALSIDACELQQFLSNSAANNMNSTLLIGETSYSFTPITNDNGKNFIGMLNDESKISIRIEDCNATIVTQDEGSCNIIIRDRNTLTLDGEDLYIKSQYDCDDFEALEKLNCEVGLETIVHTDNAFVSQYANQDAAYEAILSTISEMESFYSRLMMQTNSNGKIALHDALKEINPTQSRFYIINHGTNSISYRDTKTEFAKWLDKTYPCSYNNTAIDLHLYFSGHVPNATQPAPSPCGFGAATSIILAKSSVSLMASTLAHELGHALGASHTETYNDCSNFCENSTTILMCGNGTPNLNNAEMDKCAWHDIVTTATNNCACLSNNFMIASCGHCKFDAYFTQSLKPSISTGCSSVSNEFDVTVFIHNDCDPKTNFKFFLQFSNGSNPSAYQSSVISIGDFVSVGVNPTFNALSFLESPTFNLAPEEKKSFTCRFRLDRVIDIADYNFTISKSISTFDFSQEVDHYKTIFVTTPVRNTITKFIQDFSGNFNNRSDCGLPEGTIHVKHDLFINADHCLSQNDIIIDPGKKIIVMPGKKLILGKARVFACNDLWESIEVQEGGTLEIVESEIKSGNFAFDAKANTKVIARQNSKISSGNHGGKIKNGTSIELRGIQFEKLKGGIIVDNTNLTLESFNFNQIGTIGGLPSVADPFEGNCISFLGGGAKSIMPASTGSEGYFFNANNGIYIDNGAHKISGYTFKGVNHGIYIKNTTGSASNIEKNIMDVLSNGIFLENNGALSSLIDNNEVRAKNPLATGIYVGGQTGNTIIKRNLIDMDAGFAGIQVSSCQNTTIENNNAFNNAPTGNKSDCIYISNSNNVVASCNTVSHSGSGHGTTAIEVEETMNGEYKCNTVTGADCGMVYIAFCKPSIISGNSLSQHDIGFVISNRASGSDGITGTQFFQGNILKNSGASSDAWNFAGSLNSISESLFKVSNQSPFIPNNIQDLISLGWFTQPEGSTEFTCGSSTCPNGVGRSSANSNETDQRNFLLNNDLSIGEFSDARTWSARFAILMDIKSNQMRDGISLEWLSKFKGSSLDIFSDVAILLNRSSLQNSELISLQNKKRSLYFFNSAESNQFLEQISELDNKMQKIVEKLKKEYLSLAKYEFESLSSLQNLSEYELNMQQVLLLELKAELDHTLDLKNDVLLKSIAEQCPYSGGLAVYRARMLRQLVAKDYNDLQTCGIRQNESEKKMGMYPTIEAYPIPFTDVIYINIQSNKLIDSYNYEIVDPQGKCVQTGIVSSQGQIQTYNLPMGIYFIKISEDANLICKIIK